MDKFEGFETKQDGIRLLGLIREIMYSVKKHLKNTWALVQAEKVLQMFWQKPDMPNDEYFKLSNARVTVLEILGGPLPIHLKLVIAKFRARSYGLGGK